MKTITFLAKVFLITFLLLTTVAFILIEEYQTGWFTGSFATVLIYDEIKHI